jgi:hypothetical protein
VAVSTPSLTTATAPYRRYLARLSGRLSIYIWNARQHSGPKVAGTYIVEFRTADGESLAIRHLQERTPLRHVDL